ncbi:cupin-like domain-containing protein [Pseudoalteromonas rhizosphaerae]|uniref:Cupin-like domain-containing protein n=1 Tax=Pseudoalteromonas rhizosphaerae TaxID=2518973 RepID=A0ABW8L1E1_9GAMM
MQVDMHNTDNFFKQKSGVTLKNVKKLKSLKSINIANCEKVDSLEVTYLTKGYFKKNHIDLNYPLLIKGGVSKWPARKIWTDEYLKEKLKDTDLNCYKSMNLNDASFMQENVQRMKGSDYISLRQKEQEKVLSSPHIVLDKQWVNYDGSVYQLGLEFMTHDILPFEFLTKPKLGVSSPFYRLYLYKNAGTGWHEHPNDEYIMCQVRGSKRVALLPTKKVPNYKKLYQDLQKNDYLYKPDYFNEYEKNILVADVEEGDALYIPPHWFHGVDTLDTGPGTTLVYSFRTPLHKIGNFRYPSVKRTLSYIIKNGNKKAALGYILIAIASNTASIIKKISNTLRKKNSTVKFGDY